MKKTIEFSMILVALMLVFTLSVSATDYVNHNKGLYTRAIDTTEFRSTVMLPTEGIDWKSNLQMSLKYPQAAIEKGIEGEVIVLCTVDDKGNVSDVKILKDIGGGTGTEVAMAVKRMKFNPAIQNGFFVPVTMAIPVIFVLE
ncbi:MAG: energy transducer TonB [Bacteroidales bacterium]|nr:energy transducer TonB [Bacteroidales bacterium]